MSRMEQKRECCDSYTNEHHSPLCKNAWFRPISEQRLAEGTKDDEEKLPIDLISPYMISGTAEILQFGANKYEPYNWAKGIMFSRVWAAMQRHLWAYWAGEDLDEETGKSHLWHASCCLMFLIHYEAMGSLYHSFDDRPNYDKIPTA